MKIFKEIMSYVIIIIVVLLVKRYIFTPIRVNGSSMNPTLHNGEIMILNEIGYYINGVNRFDIVVIEKDNDKIIKRVIGLPGEKVEYKDNKLYINDELYEETFTHNKTDDFTLDEIKVDVIPKDYYFVVGDNRGNSLDSRIIGLIHKSEIRGKTKLIVYPFKKLGNVN